MSDSGSRQRRKRRDAQGRCAERPGAIEYYWRRRLAGDPHNTAIRKVAGRLSARLFFCISNGVVWDETSAWSGAKPIEEAREFAAPRRGQRHAGLVVLPQVRVEPQLLGTTDGLRARVSGDLQRALTSWRQRDRRTSRFDGVPLELQHATAAASRPVLEQDFLFVGWRFVLECSERERF